MPGPKTHEIFYKQLKSKLDEKTLAEFPNYDKYSIFAQGHDFLIYHDFYKIWNQKKLNSNISDSKLLQEYSFQEFVYNYLKSAKESGAIEDEKTRLFIGPGYIMHHILDAYTHPFIIYYSGDHIRDPKNKTWQHGIVENLIDIYMMKKMEDKDSTKYPVYEDFTFSKNIDTSLLVKTLNESLKETYNISNGGETFNESLSQIVLFMKSLKYDSTKIKKIIFDLLDPILKGTSSFSYNRDWQDVERYLNESKRIWLNPTDENISSNQSFMELYYSALNDGSQMIDDLEKICQSGIINQDEIYSIIPDISSTNGLACGQECKINNKKKW